MYWIILFFIITLFADFYVFLFLNPLDNSGNLIFERVVLVSFLNGVLLGLLFIILMVLINFLLKNYSEFTLKKVILRGASFAFLVTLLLIIKIYDIIDLHLILVLLAFLLISNWMISNIKSA